MAAKKLCFVTVGATASFVQLIAAVLDTNFLTALERHGYTNILVQYGKDGKLAFDKAASIARDAGKSIDIAGFELDAAGLGKYMRDAKGNSSNEHNEEGVVISHAGSGTVLDALRMAVPLIVVPNTSLLDNHQVELAEALAEQGYVVHAEIPKLYRALDDAEVLRRKQYEWPPVNSGKHREYNGLKGVLDDEMGFLD